MDEQLIKIGLKYAGTVYDLQVSKKTTLKSLAEQLGPALAVVNVNLPSGVVSPFLIFKISSHFSNNLPAPLTKQAVPKQMLITYCPFGTIVKKE